MIDAEHSEWRKDGAVAPQTPLSRVLSCWTTDLRVVFNYLLLSVAHHELCEVCDPCTGNVNKIGALDKNQGWLHIRPK